MSVVVDYVMSSLKRDERRALANHFLSHKTLSDDSEMQMLLDELNDEEQKAIKEAVLQNTRTVQRYDVLRDVAHDGEVCVHCGGGDVVRHGTNRERQRFQCKECERFFTELTDTPLDGCRKLETFAKFTNRDTSKTVRALADDYGISPHTVLRWKHIEEQIDC